MEKMDHLMAEKMAKIIKTAKLGKSHQKIFQKRVDHSLPKSSSFHNCL